MDYVVLERHDYIVLAPLAVTTLKGRSLTGLLATRSNWLTRNFGPARLTLLDDSDDEIKEFGVGDSIDTDGEDFTT